MRFYNTHDGDLVTGWKPCRKKPIIVFAKQIDEEFKVLTKEGEHLGKKGDYLMLGIEGELYVHDGELFEKAYNILPETKATTKRLNQIIFKPQSVKS